MKLNFKKEGFVLRFIKDGGLLYFYHPEGLIIFKKEQISDWVYLSSPSFILKTNDWEYVFTSNLSIDGDRYSANRNILYHISLYCKRSEYWLCPKGISNLKKLIVEL